MRQASGFDEAPALFGSACVSPVVSRLLQDAAQCYAQTHRAESLLWTAQVIDPHCLPVFFALYKFYFYKGMLVEAERVTRAALLESARQAGFDPEWCELTRSSSDWDDRQGPQHFYLFSLKALAFIALRLGRSNESEAILAKLGEIDPQDSVGASVIREIAHGAKKIRVSVIRD